MKNKEREPMKVVIHQLDENTNQIEKIEIKDKEICSKLEYLLQKINITDTISRIYLICFWFICALLAAGLYLYITKFEFIFSFIIFIGLFNVFNLKQYNTWQELKESSQNEFSDIIDNYLKIRRINNSERTTKETM